MATINLANDKIQLINEDLSSLNSMLISTYFPNLLSTIGEIKSNVQSSQLNSILGTIVTRVENISSNIQKELTKLVEFLNSQLKSYFVSEQEAEYRVNNVLQKMQHFVDNMKNSLDRMVGIGVATVGTSGTGIGAGIGSFFSPIGTAVGTVFGAGIGTLVGAYAGYSEYMGGFDAMLESAAYNVKETVSDVAGFYADTWNSIWD